MDPVFVFGYGSLLERGAGTPCRLGGHRRQWGVAMDNRRTIPGYKYFLEPGGARPEVYVAFLDAVPEPGASCAGLAFPVDPAVLGELDARERNYRRVDVTALVDADLGGRVWAYLGLDEARERFEAGVRAGTAVVSRAYVEGARAGLAAYGLSFGPEPPVPVRDLTLVRVPRRTSTAAG
jgi:cation transport regulator ChaC